MKNGETGSSRESRRLSSWTSAFFVVRLFLAAILVTTISYPNKSNATVLASPSVTVSLVPVENVTLDNEAQQQGQAYWRRILTKCGEFYFFGESHKIYEDPAPQPQKWYQSKGLPVIRVVGRYHPPRQLTEAERLNRVDPQPIEWDGRVTLTFRIGRTMKTRGYGYDDRPPERYGWADNPTVERTIIKKKGRWDIYEAPAFKDVRVSCEEADEILSGSPPKQRGNSTSECEHRLGAAIRAKWMEARGNNGFTCPVMDETDATPSPLGTTGRYADFERDEADWPGTIHAHSSGRYRGKAFITYGAIFRLYKNLGGSSSWLGFPTSDEHDASGGRRSDFEGGFIHWNSETGEALAFRY